MLDLVERLRAPSYQQDSAWHDPKTVVYVTKPRALLEEAADTIERYRALLEEAGRTLGPFARWAGVFNFDAIKAGAIEAYSIDYPALHAALNSDDFRLASTTSEKIRGELSRAD